ncbi:MAG: oligosaccharide flippase family protein [Cyanobacteria bacterium J06631_2]
MSSSSLKKLALRGTVWTVAGYGTGQVLRFGSNLVLTRLLVPELFGLMALVQVFIQGLTLFSDIGIRPSIIRSDRGDEPVFLDTAWTIQVIRGLLLWLCCLIIALPVAYFYGDPRLRWLIPLVGLSTILLGFQATSIATLNRRLEMSKLALFELGTQLVSLAVLITWAWLSPTIWALVGGNLVSVGFKTLVSHCLLSERLNRFAWNRTVVDEITSFGRWILLSTAMMFLASQIDRILLGKIFSLQTLGIYLVAFTFADVPRQVSIKIGNQVIFPTFSQLLNLPRERLRAKIISKREQVVLALALFLSLLCCFGDQIILNLYDARYLDAAWMLPVLGLGLWPLLLCQTVNPILLSVGQPKYIAWGNLSKFLYMLVAFPLASSIWGTLGAVMAIALNDLPLYILVNYGLYREKLAVVVQDLRLTLYFCLFIALFSGLRIIFGLNFAFTSASI